MNWLVWQQHKKHFLILAIFLAIFAAILTPSELHLYPVVRHVVTVCGKPSAAWNCLGSTVTTFDTVLFFATTVIARYTLLALPFVLGLFWGVPLIANEYVNGTNKLIWTRSVSRRKWLTVKLLWILVAAAVFVTAFTLIATWWSRVSGMVYTLNNVNDTGAQLSDRFSSMAFDATGFVPAAYAIFGVALGIAVGSRFKRILPALAVTLGVFVALQVVVPSFIRPHYASPKTIDVALSANDLGGSIAPIPTSIGQAWILSGKVVGPDGRAIDYGNPPAKCANKLQNNNPKEAAACLTNIGYHWLIKYQPSYRYWDFQRIEAGLYVALSLIPIGFTYRLVERRDA